MITGETKIRVRYGETDNMGYVYYGTYAVYFEIGRTELIRQFGLTYKQLEEMGTIMPVNRMNIEYKHPAKYDDILTIITTVKKMPSVRITFHSEIFNQNKNIIATGDVTLVFVDANKRRPIRPPEILISKIKKYFI